MSTQRPRSLNFGRSSANRARIVQNNSNLAQYAEPLVASGPGDIENQRNDALETSSVMETMSASNMSEYTLNSTGTSAASMGGRNSRQNTVLEDAALS